MNFPSWLERFLKGPTSVPPGKYFSLADCPKEDSLRFTVASAILPPEQFSLSAYSLILRALKNGDLSAVQEIIVNTGYEPIPGTLHTFADLSSEARLRFLFDFTLQFCSSIDWYRQGFDPDVLNEFPAQRLIQVQMDVKEPVDWKTFWPANGGMIYNGEMIALKWDRVWRRISFLDIPVPPFQIRSGYDVEDVDRDEALSIGVLKPRQRGEPVCLEINLAALRDRLSAALVSL